MNALIADRDEEANQYNRMRLKGLGLHIIEPPGTHDHRKSMGQALWFLVDMDVAHSVLNQPLAPH